MPAEIVDILVVRADTLEPRMADWVELLVGWERARRAVLADRSVADALASGVDLTPEEYRATLAGLTLSSLQDSVRLLSGPSPELKRVGEGIAETMRRLGLIGRSLDWGALLDARPAARASAAVEKNP
jgi:NitT/TauT family transport system substrate-binding protein